MIALAITTLGSLLAAFNIRRGLLFFVFMLAFMPRSIAIPIGSEGMALTAQRTWTALLFIYFIIMTIQSSKIRASIARMLEHQSKLVFLISALLALKLLATVLFGEARHLLYFIDDALFSAFVFTLFFVYVKDRKYLEKILFMMVLGLFVTAALNPVEKINAAPLLSSIVESRIQGADIALTSKSRDGAHRVQALFDHPLLLTEFVVITLPFALYFWKTTRGRRKLLAGVTVIAVPFILLSTGSRSGILVGAASIITYYLAIYWPILTKKTRYLLSLIFAIFLAISLAQAFSYIVTQGELRETTPIWEFEEEERSTIERASQYILVTSEIFGGNYLGFGVKQDYEKELSFIHNLDNYLLRLLLEGGVLALFLFTFILYLLFRKSGMMLKNSYSLHDRRLASALLAFIVAFTLMKLFLSMPTNNIYLYIVFGAFFGAASNSVFIKSSNISNKG